MSHTLHPLRRQRLQRYTLAVPGSNPSMIEKAADSAADVIFLDLEDAVAPPEKEKARKNIIKALYDGEIMHWMGFDFRWMEVRDEGGLLVLLPFVDWRDGEVGGLNVFCLEAGLLQRIDNFGHGFGVLGQCGLRGLAFRGHPR